MESSSDAGAKCSSSVTTSTANGTNGTAAICSTNGTSAICAANGSVRYQSCHYEWKLHSTTGTAILPTVVTGNGDTTTISSTVDGIPADIL